jgi:CRISPR-associated protein Csd2
MTTATMEIARQRYRRGCMVIDPTDRRFSVAVMVSFKNANPNGNACNGRPRLDPTGRCMASAPSVKAKMRDVMVNRRGASILNIRGRNRIDVLADALTEELREKFLKKDKKMPPEEHREINDVLHSFHDVFLHGCVTPLQNYLGTDSPFSGAVAGAFTLNEGLSRDPVKLVGGRGTAGVTGEADRGKPQTFTERWFIDFGLFRFEGGMDPVKAKNNQVPAEGVDALVESLCYCYEDSRAATRANGNVHAVVVFERPAFGPGTDLEFWQRVKFQLKEGAEDPKLPENYDITVDSAGLEDLQAKCHWIIP